MCSFPSKYYIGNVPIQRDPSHSSWGNASKWSTMFSRMIQISSGIITNNFRISRHTRLNVHLGLASIVTCIRWTQAAVRRPHSRWKKSSVNHHVHDQRWLSKTTTMKKNVGTMYVHAVPFDPIFVTFFPLSHDVLCFISFSVRYTNIRSTAICNECKGISCTNGLDTSSAS